MSCTCMYAAARFRTLSQRGLRLPSRELRSASTQRALRSTSANEPVMEYTLLLRWLVRGFLLSTPGSGGVWLVLLCVLGLWRR